MNRTIVIDADNLCYRCRHAYSLSNKNEDTSVLYGFVASIIAEIKKHKPTSVVVCWDKGIPSYRKELFPEYKAGRHQGEDKDLWEDFKRQMRELKDFVSSLGMSNLVIDGFEADDLMYWISKLILDEVIIISTDNDILQTIDVSKRIKVWNPIKKHMITFDNFYEIVGVKANQYIDYKIMTGDGSDNIEGIRGIGEKTASEILSSYMSLWDAFQHVTNGDWKCSKRAKTCLMKADTNRVNHLRELFDLSKPGDDMICEMFDQVDNWKPYDNSEAQFRQLYGRTT